MLFRFLMLAAFMLTIGLARLDDLERDGPEGLCAMYALSAAFLFAALFPELLLSFGYLLLIPAVFILCYLAAIAAIVIIALAGRSGAEVRYLLVPGTIVIGSKPSRLLRGRLDAAEQYLLSHPETKCVLSGGRVEGRSFSEAEVMAEYLGKAVSPDRVFTEDQSTSTYANFKNSLPLLRGLGMTGNDTVAVCTDLFHYARCLWLARKCGYKKLCFVPSLNGSSRCAGWFFREVMVFVRLWMKGADYKS